MWYRNDKEIDLEDFFSELLEEHTEWVEERVESMLDECYEPWRFGAAETLYPSEIVKECKPYLWTSLISDEKDYIISDWFYNINNGPVGDGITLYAVLQEWDFENEMREIVWKDEEDA